MATSPWSPILDDGAAQTPAPACGPAGVHLRTNLLATGQYITAFPHSVLFLYAHRFSLKALPLDLPTRPWPVAVLTLKNRTLSPVVERFIECARDVAKSVAHRPQAIKS
jgi:DNA-binding transcriptional LysR family regulator